MAYTTLSDLTANTTLTAGTYYLETNVNLSSYTLTFDCSSGPIIIKRNGDVYFTNVGVVNTINSSVTNKVYWTVKDDDTIGETIEGSTGSPSASGGSFNNAVAANSVSLNFVYWEIRWNARTFLTCANTVGFKFYYIIVRNCSLSSGSFIQNQVYSGNNQIFDTIYIDNTNYFSGNSRILSVLYNGTASYVTKIKSEAHVTSSTCPISLGDWQNSAKKSFSYIYCLNESGVSALEISRSPLISNCYLEGGLTLNPNSLVPTIKNCILFKGNSINTKGITIRGTGTSFLGASRIINNIIIGFARGAIDVIVAHGSNSHNITEFRNNIITNNGYVLYWANLNTNANITASGWSNNIFYNNTNFGGGCANWNTWTQQATDITADPQFQNAPSGCVIDTEFAKYIPDGYFVGNLEDIEEKGSDTFNNLDINEDQYTATGKRYNGNTLVTPGVNYKVTSFLPSSESSESSVSSTSVSKLSVSSTSSDSSFSSDSSISISSWSSNSISSSSSVDSKSSTSSLSSDSSVSSISTSSESSQSSMSSLSSLSSPSVSKSSTSSDSSQSSISISSTSSGSSISISSTSSDSSKSSFSISSPSSLSSNSSISFSSTSSPSSDSSRSSISISSTSSLSSPSSPSSESSDSSISISSTSSISSESSPSSTSSTSSRSSDSSSSNSSNSSSSNSSDSSSSISSESSSSNSSDSSSSLSSDSSSSNSSDSSSSRSSMSSNSNSSDSSSSNSSDSSSSNSSISSSSNSSFSSDSSSSNSSNSSSSNSSVSSSSNSSTSSSSNSSDSSSSNSSTSSSSNSSTSSSSLSSDSSSSNSSFSSNSSQSSESFDSKSSSSSLTDCIDWKITEALLAQLSTMSSGYNTKINTVRLMETDYKDTLNPPMLIICPNEVDPNNEYLSRSDNLPFALIYIDNSNDKNLHYRFRHVAPDIQRCLKKNPTMNDLAQVVKVLNWESSVFVIENIEITCCVVYINVERTLDTDNPYKLS